MAELCGDSTQRLRRMWFFDVGVKRVEMYFDVGGSHVLNQTGSVRLGIEEISLEPVQRLEAKRDSKLLTASGSGVEALNRPLPFLLGSPAACYDPETRVKRATDQTRAEVCGPLHALLEELAAPRPHLSLRAYQIHLAGHHTAGGAAELQLVKHVLDGRYVRRLFKRKKDLHAVETPAANAGQQGLLLLGDPSSPHHGVDAVLHLPTSSGR